MQKEKVIFLTTWRLERKKAAALIEQHIFPVNVGWLVGWIVTFFPLLLINLLALSLINWRFH